MFRMVFMINRRITFIALIYTLQTITAGNGIAQSVKDSLPGIQDAIPRSWTCRIVVPTDSNEWPTGLGKPLFNTIFNDTESLITGCTPQETHPDLKLCFYPIANANEIEDIIVKESIFSWCIPIKYLVSPRYFIVTSPCYINHGCFSTIAQNLVAPLDSALAKYFKSVHVQLRDSVVVDPHMFSGRVDPQFVIHDSADVALIRHKLDSLTTLLTLKGIPAVKNHSWWPGIRVTYIPLPFIDYRYYPLEIGRDSIATGYQNESRVMSITNSDFEKTIIDILVEEKSVSIRGRDTIRADELFKSFHMITEISPDKFVVRTKPKAKESLVVGINGTQVELHLNAPSRTTVELFDSKGRVIDVVYKGMMQAGVSKITLSQKNAAEIVGILRVKTDTETKVVRTTFFK